MTTSSKKALIDADSLVYAIGFSSKDIEEPLAKWRLDEAINNILTDVGAVEYEGWITGKGNYRNDIAVTAPYKGQRKTEKPEHYDALREHMLKKWKFHKTEGVEADDAVGIAAYAVPEDAVIMVHIDKDLNQFRGWHYNYRNKETYYVTEFNGLKSFYTQILTGDRIDNIIGIKGIGAVKAERILKECKTENEMYLAVLEAYNGDSERVLENGQLLWLQREVNQVWQPPQLSMSSGSMQSQTEDGKTISK
jgi:hypothetical protein